MFGRREFLRRAGTAVVALLSCKIVRAEKPEPDFQFKPGTLQLVPLDKIIIDHEHDMHRMPNFMLREIVDSILREGLIHPLTVDDRGVLVDGFGRYQGAEILGVKKVLCYVCEKRVYRRTYPMLIDEEFLGASLERKKSF